MLANEQNTFRRFLNSLNHNEEVNALAIGCSKCPDLGLCGGLYIEAGRFNCLDFCCHNPECCNTVCRNNAPVFTNAIREVDRFELINLPATSVLETPNFPSLVPLIKDGSSRNHRFKAPAVAIPLFDLFSRKTGDLKFPEREVLCNKYKIRDDAKILLSGTAEDQELEDWWGLGPKREEIIRKIRSLGIELVTTPNFSSFKDVPRWEEFHNMKRIAIAWHEFQNEGVSAALHLNARTNRDWQRWIEFLNHYPQVKCVSFEFGTGAGDSSRIHWYVDQLDSLAKQVPQKLTLIVRGGSSVLRRFKSIFESVVSIDTDIFLKTIKRRMGFEDLDFKLRWRKAQDNDGELLDSLLQHNYEITKERRW